MLILGLLLVVVSVVAAAVLIAYNSGGTAETVSAFGRDIADVTLMQAFVAGIVVSLVFLLGLWMIMLAGRRGRENRHRYREARREAKTAAAERDELAEKLRKDEEHHATQHTQPVPAQPTQPMANQSTVDTSTDNSPRHAAHDQQPVITNIRPGQSPSR
jgi:ABC-type nickel/cobalt efflux system permease component RcnA